MNKSIAIIPARGGSKRILRKNIKPFLGQPIIKYSIDAAFESGLFDEIMVSTDDDEIAKLSLEYGANVPFMRSPEKANDYATTADVLEEVLCEYKKRGEEFLYACCIYPTAPFITTEKLKTGFTLLQDKDADSVIPVVRFSYPIQRALKIENKKVKRFWPEYAKTRSQDLEPAYHDVGQFYWFNVKMFLENKALLGENAFPIEVTELEMQDLDTEEDWKVAEIKYYCLYKTE